MTFAITFGKYAGFWVNFGRKSGMYRICLGWISIDLFLFEIDEIMGHVAKYKKRADKLEAEIKKFIAENESEI